MSEKMMICPKHATCQRTCKEIGRHCGPHTKPPAVSMAPISALPASR